MNTITRKLKAFDTIQLPSMAKLVTIFSNTHTQLNLWSERAISRKDLSKLDAHLLADIGLSEKQANGEANKAFWKD